MALYLQEHGVYEHDTLGCFPTMRNCYITFDLKIEPRCEKTSLFAFAKNKDADQLRDNREADQRLCFR